MVRYNLNPGPYLIQQHKTRWTEETQSGITTLLTYLHVRVRTHTHQVVFFCLSPLHLEQTQQTQLCICTVFI